ncbi:enolase C-terminal domain-like protein [Exidia glandulosa HHB12029]|uniref:Enolase C-terminal domain-like protein n=1 Tax=Exidia glandulosa HHB12029 TaxID=1314781 RepID=A0A166BUR2_EXIGL|nr:enolase C-terminal domain-like protein [Exidia glandulosa HHB12029]
MMADTIISIEAFRVAPRWLFVRIETAQGIVGWGEATLEGHTEAVEGALQDLSERLLGRNPNQIEDAWIEGYRGRFYRGGPVLMSAISGVDIALWDIKGKRLGVPVYELLGGAVRDKIAVYGWIGGDKAQDVLEGAKQRKAQGFRAVKMNGTEMIGWLDSPSALDSAVSNIAAVRSLGIDVAVDFHGRVHKAMAKQLAKALEPHRPLFIEEPLLPTQPQEIAQLAKLTSCPIALGERLYTRHDFRPYLEAGAVDIAQPDVAHCGGITELRKIASLVETYDVALAPHCPMGPIALAACLQVDAVTPNFAIQEMSWQIHYNQGADLMTYITNPEVFGVKDGHVRLPNGPGLGVNINEELVRKAALTAKAWRNPLWRDEDGSVREW